MITKKSFIAIIKAIKKQQEADDKNGEILTRLADPEFQNHKIIFTTPIISQLLDILKAEMGCEEQDIVGDDISYWVYELDFGKKDNEMGIYRKDGTRYKLATPEDLYEYIVSPVERDFSQIRPTGKPNIIGLGEYEDIDLIQELKERGYEITKKD